VSGGNERVAPLAVVKKAGSERGRIVSGEAGSRNSTSASSCIEQAVSQINQSHQQNDGQTNEECREKEDGSEGSAPCRAPVKGRSRCASASSENPEDAPPGAFLCPPPAPAVHTFLPSKNKKTARGPAPERPPAVARCSRSNGMTWIGYRARHNQRVSRADQGWTAYQEAEERKDGHRNSAAARALFATLSDAANSVPVTDLSRRSVPRRTARLGHADPNVTSRIYSQARPEDDRRAADTWDDVIDGPVQ